MTKKSKGFTLLEIITVIVISFVLAILAMPRLFSMVEYSRASEALNSIDVIRTAVEQCYLKHGGGSFTSCDTISEMSIKDPGTLVGAHFTYEIIPNGEIGFSIKATRNTLDNGNNEDYILITQTQDSISRVGQGAFKGIQ